MRLKIINRAALIAVIIMLISCGMTGIIVDMPPPTVTEMPPFVITKPVIEINERTNYFCYAGMIFKFYNLAEEYVDKITVSFMLFDNKTELSPFISNNKFEISKWDYVFPNENKEIIISLDQFIYIAPTEPYLIDFFYISEIHYGNGGIWQDRNGIYRVRNM
jgi:hypothetical protein